MNRINQISQEWPRDVVATADWLQSKGIYRQLIDIYINSGWLERIGPGAYKRKGDTVNWSGGLYALQKLQRIPVHVGSKTALELHGLGHYIRMSDTQKIVLWKTPDVRVPSWFLNFNWKADLQIRSATLFSELTDVLSKKQLEQVEITISPAERAILEYLYDIPKYEGIDEANYIMEGLSTLRPALLQKLLNSCTSVKVKRIFLYLAEHHDHPWFKRLDTSTITLGTGKREIVKGGKLNKKYQIVVPDLSREDR